MNSSCDTAASDEHISEPLAISAACFSSMGLLCCIQMFFMIGITFRRRSGLYFWSLIGATVAQTAVCLSVILQNWILKDRLIGIPVAMSTLGYLFFAPFEYLVLYSRLHLLQASKRALKFVLILAFLEWSLAELPMALTGALATIYPESTKIALVYKIWWEFEEAVYPAVDFAMCFIYFLQVKRMWGHSEDKMKWVLRQVILMSTVMVLIDISYLVLTNTMNADWCAAIEAFFFALKLHIEIYTLNMLTEISSRKHSQMQDSFGVELSVTTQDSNNYCWTASDGQDAKLTHTDAVDSQKKDSNRRRSLPDSIIERN